ncbi:MAG: hypothetical protein RLZ56_1355 [Bacteroidota bacterium]|jgi:hypothetical protein
MPIFLQQLLAIPLSAIFFYVILTLLIKDVIKRKRYFKIITISYTSILFIYTIVARLTSPPIHYISLTNYNGELKNNICYMNPGFQTISLAPSFLFDAKRQQNPSMFSYLNLDFTTDSNGYIKDKPAIYFTGVDILSLDINYIAPVQINRSSKTSEFTIIVNSKTWIIGATNTFKIIVSQNGAVSIKKVAFQTVK